MYERFYNLRERPFSLTPDPDYLYPSRVHSEALSYLRYGIEGHAGFVVITGEIGSGKTTLLQTVLRGLDRQTSVSRLVNTMLDARELIEAVMLDFGLQPSAGQSKPMLLRDLARFLVDQRLAGRLALLVIDEAQNLSPAALEEVRMLSNLETEKSKLIQVVMIGQPNLRDVLARPDLEQLRQRITISYHLEALEADDTSAYINHRLRRAALGAPLQMTREVTDVIHQAAQGVPRKINIIADALLLFGYGEDRHVLDTELTHQVLQELEATGVIVPPGDVPERPRGPVAPPGEARRVPAASAPPGEGAAIAAASERLAAREHELSAREAQLAVREKQLMEQRRVLVEGFELLRSRREIADPSHAPIDRPAWPPPRPASAPLQPALTRAVTPSMPSDSMWTRIRRTLFGSPKPIFED
jgi:putative secretion ATPase (PEP-CTERM system associated)